MTLPCALCGWQVELGSTLCPDCGGDPAAELIPCDECEGSGSVVYAVDRSGRDDGDPVECRGCRGNRTASPPYAGERAAALADLEPVRGWDETAGRAAA